MEKESEVIYKIIKLHLEKKILQTEIDFLIDSLIDDEVEIFMNKITGDTKNEN